MYAERSAMGAVIKGVLMYETPFWNEKGLSGFVISDRIIQDEAEIEKNSPISAQLLYPASALDAEGNRQFGIVCFFLGKTARLLSAKTLEEERKKIAAECVQRMFQDDRALEVREYLEHDWCADPWSLGAFMSIPSPGTLTTVKLASRQAVGRIHWAGTESATRWPGYMEGAVNAAERVVQEILPLLQ